MDHFFNNIPGFFSFRPVYDIGLSRIDKNGTWVEIGSWQGRSISYLAVESINRNLNLNIFSVDIWMLSEKHKTEKIKNDSDLYNTFLENIKPVSNNIKIIKEYSWEAANFFEDDTVDFAMIDADHSYESVIKDISAWWPKIKKGGMLVGDDLRGSFPGVRKAIEEFSKKNNLNWQKLSGCWMLYK